MVRGVLGVLLSGAAVAAPVLHEPVEVPRLRCEDGICRTGIGDLPEAVVLDGRLVRAPGRRPPGGEEPRQLPMASGLPGLGRGVPASGEPPSIRRLHVAPDRMTEVLPTEARVYHEVFNPAVYPFKRMSVLDAVQADETLTLRDGRLLTLMTADARLSQGYDPFYGDVVIELAEGRPVPLPTPAAGARLLAYEAVPPRALRFFRDGADSLYVAAADGKGGRHRVLFLMEAPRRYFAGPLLPPGAARPRLRDVPEQLRPLLPRAVQRHADRVLRHIGLAVAAENELIPVLERLVAYFRAFEVGPLRGQRGSTYLDLALEQRGACRHRAYAFVITALGAGLPARYVENEVHVFAEVFVPVLERGQAPSGYWRRVHLGGAPLEARVLDAEDKIAYPEGGQDPLPRPPAFVRAEQAQSRSALEVRHEAGGAGQGGQGAARGQGASAEAGPSGGGKSLGARTQGPEAMMGASAGTSMSGGRSMRAESPQAPQHEPVQDEPAWPRDARPDSPGQRLTPTRLTVSIPRGAGRGVYRGALLPVTGQVEVAGGSPAELEVCLFLDTADGMMPLGRTRADASGALHAEVEIPRHAPLGNHRIVAHLCGEAGSRGSRSPR
ncbi:MAG: hypothetical protein RMK29_07590 [Myxococcales bacterium]|nr:hypothetical protein [Myxococcota bacterium]MDW8281557.1 hypothetical protein [Myxococcales bacterium]